MFIPNIEIIQVSFYFLSVFLNFEVYTGWGWNNTGNGDNSSGFNLKPHGAMSGQGNNAFLWATNYLGGRYFEYNSHKARNVTTSPTVSAPCRCLKD